MRTGDIILIPFPFTDLSAVKTRPALILYTSHLDITVVFITSRMIQRDLYDVEITMDSQNGLKVNSIIKLSKIATLDRSLAIGKLGEVNDNDLIRIKAALQQLFDLKR
jgi:mRNA interferase MazF